MLTTLEEQFGYISDPKRLALFGQAVAQAVRPDDTVADIGCGFGILGLLCLKAGAAQVWGIDSTDAIEIARETMVRAGLGDRYTCIREQSFRVALSAPVNVIICDHVGYFGIDYGIIALLADARSRFLKPGGRVIPNQIRLMLAGVSSSACRAKADAWAASSIPAEYHWLREYGVSSKHARMFSPNEIATEPQLLGTVDLTTDSPDLLTYGASLRVTSDCTIEGIAGWFDCELTDGIWMTNSPLAEDKIDRDQVFLAFDKPVPVIAGDLLEVSVAVRHRDGIIAWTVKDPRTGQRQKQSTWSSLIVNPPVRDGRQGKALRSSPSGIARKVVLDYVNGKRTAKEIEAAVLHDYPDLFPSAAEICRFVQGELVRSTE